MIKGVIKTCLSEKQYGFIKGEDGRDYYFSFNALTDKGQIERLAEGALVEFDQKATARGYRAESISITKEHELRYSEPTEVLVSREKSIQGWEIIEKGNWIVHASSRESPDDAKHKLAHSAKLVGANAVIESEYYKTTGSESGSGNGTHYYSIHNFRARVAMVGKKDIGGSLSLEDLVGLNQKAEELKRSYIESNQLNEAANQKIRERIWSGGAALVGLLIAIVKHSSLAIGWVIVVGILILILPIFFYKPNNQGDWLIRG